jgi:hypothetical protein
MVFVVGLVCVWVSVITDPIGENGRAAAVREIDVMHALHEDGKNAS